MMKKITVLIVKCVCVMLPLIAVCMFARTKFLGFADQEAPYYVWNRGVCNTKNNKAYDVLILGDSTSNGAYVPELLSDSTLNLALGGTTSVENYYVLKEYLDHHEIPKVIYLSFSDAHMVSEDCFYARTLYSHRFHFDSLSEILSRAKYYNEPSIMTDTYQTDWISYALYLPNKYMTSMMNGSLNQRKEENDRAMQKINLHRGRYISLGNGTNTAAGEIVFDRFSVMPLFDEYYKKIIELCAQNGIAVRVVKLPLDENVVFTDQYEAEFWNYYSALLRQYDNLTVEWLDESDGHFYFGDVVHMNNRGARNFSETIKTIYPEDFSRVISDGQMEVIDRDIQMESDMLELFQWIRGKEYTMLLYDGTGCLQEIYGEELKSGFGLNLVYTGSENMYYVSGMNLEVPIAADIVDGVYQVRVNQGNIYDWSPVLSNCISVCVINNRSGIQICTKNFLRQKAFYVMID